MSTEEAEAAIQLSLSGSVLFSWALDTNIWMLQLLDSSGEVLWEDEATDRRLLLFNAYGHILDSAGMQPQNPIWRRSGEVNIPTRYGALSYQGDLNFNDPHDDLDPEEIKKIYKLSTKDET